MNLSIFLSYLRHTNIRKSPGKDLIYKFSDIKEAHIELTNKCNAACPQCARNVYGSFTNPNLNLSELSLDDFKKIIDPSFLKQLKFINFNGNYGDPCMSDSVIPIISYIREYTDELIININTNGGMKNPQFWTDLGNILRPYKDDRVHFSIDGLKETNHLYRQNVVWDKLMDNVKAYLATGAKASWDYVVFKHNEHQVEKAQELAKDLGMCNFFLKRTGRFGSLSKGKPILATPAYNHKGELSHLLEAPTKKEYQNERVQEVYHLKGEPDYPRNIYYVNKKNIKENRKITLFDLLKSSPKELESVQNCSINCHVKKRNSIFVNSDGLITPCCWTAWPIDSYWKSLEVVQLRDIAEITGGMNKINAKHTPLNEIIEGPFFQYIASSWNVDSFEKGRVIACAKTCGDKLTKLQSESPKVPISL